MTQIVRLLKWIVKAAVFFVLFAFALNNQQEATVHLIFGYQWRTPMILIVLVAFAIGMVVGIFGMLPGWWSRRRKDTPAAPAAPKVKEASLPDELPYGV